MLGLDNVIVVGGDAFTERDLSAVKDVRDFRPTELIAAIKSMNQGVDYKGLKLRSPTDFCVGAAIDLGRGIEREARLTRAKASAGADFFITQPIYDLDQIERFREGYEAAAGEPLAAPVFWGVQVLDAKGTRVRGRSAVHQGGAGWRERWCRYSGRPAGRVPGGGDH